MKISGFEKLTLLDYPGKLACVLFLYGCNFKCGFCHNPELVMTNRSFETGALQEEAFFSFLLERRNKLDGVCVTGGEPTIQKDILEFLAKIKKMGFLVKLDTNGTRPDVLKKAYQRELVDFVAMDIKNSLENYHKACGLEFDLERIKLSAKLIRNSRKPYEFRTTVVPGIHTYQDFELIGKWLDGSESYALQPYSDKGKVLDDRLKEKAKKARVLDIEKIKKMLKSHFDKIEIKN